MGILLIEVLKDNFKHRKSHTPSILFSVGVMHLVYLLGKGTCGGVGESTKELLCLSATRCQGRVCCRDMMSELMWLHPLWELTLKIIVHQGLSPFWPRLDASILGLSMFLPWMEKILVLLIPIKENFQLWYQKAWIMFHLNRLAWQTLEFPHCKYLRTTLTGKLFWVFLTLPDLLARSLSQWSLSLSL